MRAALHLLMWRKFLTRQRQLLLYLAVADNRLEGHSAITSEDDRTHAKCLNNTNRSISMKLVAASLLASASMSRSYQAESNLLVRKTMQRKSYLCLGVFWHLRSHSWEISESSDFLAWALPLTQTNNDSIKCTVNPAITIYR